MISKVVKHNNRIYLTNNEPIKEGDWSYSAIREIIWQCPPLRFLSAGFIDTEHKIIASNADIDVLPIPQEFIQVCMDNEEVELQYHYRQRYLEEGEIQSPLRIASIIPVEKVQWNWGDTLTITAKYVGMTNSSQYELFDNLDDKFKKEAVRMLMQRANMSEFSASDLVYVLMNCPNEFERVITNYISEICTACHIIHDKVNTLLENK